MAAIKESPTQAEEDRPHPNQDQMKSICSERPPQKLIVVKNGNHRLELPMKGLDTLEAAEEAFLKTQFGLDTCSFSHNGKTVNEEDWKLHLQDSRDLEVTLLLPSQKLSGDYVPAPVHVYPGPPPPLPPFLSVKLHYNQNTPLNWEYDLPFIRSPEDFLKHTDRFILASMPALTPSISPSIAIIIENPKPLPNRLNCYKEILMKGLIDTWCDRLGQLCYSPSDEPDTCRVVIDPVLREPKLYELCVKEGLAPTLWSIQSSAASRSDNRHYRLVQAGDLGGVLYEIFHCANKRINTHATFMIVAISERTLALTETMASMGANVEYLTQAVKDGSYINNLMIY